MFQSYQDVRKMIMKTVQWKLFIIEKISAQIVARLTQEPDVPGSIPGPATYLHFSFC